MAAWLAVKALVSFSPVAIYYCSAYGKWVVVGNEAGQGKAYESADGLVWTQLVTGLEANYTNFVAVSGIDLGVSRGYVIIVGESGALKDILEMDSVGAWTVVKTGLVASVNVSGNPIAYLPGAGFCLLRSSGVGAGITRSIYTSNDGVTWAGPATVTIGQSIGIKLGLYFVLFENNLPDLKHYLSYSSDGAVWNTVELPFTLSAITYLEGVTPFSSGGHVAGITGAIRSGDALFDNWVVLSTFPVESYNLIYHFGISKLLRFSTTASAISDDGVSWTSIPLPVELDASPLKAYGTTEIVIADINAILVMKSTSNPFGTFTEDVSITTPTEPEPENDDPDDKLSVSVTFNTDNDSLEEVDGFAVFRNNIATGESVFAGTILNDDAPGTRVFEDTVPEVGTYTYTVFAYSTINGTVSESVTSDEFSVPDIYMVGSGGIDLGGAAPTVFILDPSGIYTIVPGKRHDTLYERMTEIDSVDVKIPDPFAQTAFIGDSQDE